MDDQIDHAGIEAAVASVQNQPKKVETKTEPQAESNPDKSSQFAAYKREQRKLDAQKAQLNSERSEVEKLKALKSTAKQNPSEALKELGLSIDDILLSLADEPAQVEEDEISVLRREINEVKTSRQKEKDEQAKAAEQAINEAVEAYKADTFKHIKADPDKYELIHNDDAYDVVWELMQQHHAQTGELLSAQDAADMVEEELYEKATKLLNSKKLSKKPSAKDVMALLNKRSVDEDEVEQPRKRSRSISQNLNSAAQPVSFDDIDDPIERMAAIAKSFTKKPK